MLRIDTSYIKNWPKGSNVVFYMYENNGFWIPN